MIWVFPDNINTDFISPARHNLTPDLSAASSELAKIAFVEYRPEFAKNVKEGDIIVAGENFGCGSSRESAAMALKGCALKAILAKSFARIFYRNAINIGLPCITVDTSGIDEGDDVEVDFGRGIVADRTKGFERGFTMEPLTKRILSEGGIIAYLKKNGLDSLDGLV